MGLAWTENKNANHAADSPSLIWNRKIGCQFRERALEILELANTSYDFPLKFGFYNLTVILRKERQGSIPFLFSGAAAILKTHAKN